MDKLELKHLACYLPYKLEVHFEGEDLPHELIGLDITDRGAQLLSPYNDYGTCSLDRFKPILRPLSALTAEELKEINHCRHDEFHIAYMYGGDVVFDCENGDAYGATELPYDVVEKLLEWHYDIFNLIGRNLAADATKLEGGI